MGPTPLLHNATKTLPSCLQASLLLQGTTGLRSPAHPILLPTATSQSARSGLLGDIFAVP